MFTLDDFSKQVMRPMLFKAIEQGMLDYSIQLEDCQDIIDNDPELRKVVDERLRVCRDKMKQ